MDTLPQDPKDPISEVLDITPIVQNNNTNMPIVSQQLDTDFEYARGNIINILEKGNEALDGIMDVAQRSQSARAYEVVAGLLKNMSDMNKDLLELQKKKKDLVADTGAKQPSTVNNNLFVGSTAELQKLLKKQRDGDN